MKFAIIGRLAGALALTVALAGCIDMTMDLEIQSETEGAVTVTSVMSKDIYPMMKAGAAGEQQGTTGTDGFCDTAAGATLTEHEDGSATCVETKQGTFADIMDGDDSDATFTVVSPGVVRVAFKTEDMKTDLDSSTGGEEAMDAETKAMMEAFFEGHFITLRVSGNRVTDTNMTPSSDGSAAEIKIPFLDLMNGTTTLPDELYAVVDTN